MGALEPVRQRRAQGLLLRCLGRGVLALLAALGASVLGPPVALGQEMQSAEASPQEVSAPAASQENAPEPVIRGVDIERVELRFQGKKLHMMVTGPAEGLPVLLLHGGRYTAENWRELGTIEVLARAGYRVLALDLPGFGLSEATEVPRERFLGSLLPLLTGQPVVVVAPSMSGSFALPLVLKRPSYVAGFVPIAPGGLDTVWDELGKMTAPTLIVWGENDETFPVSQAHKLGEILPNSQTLILPGGAHAGYFQQPELFHRELLGFLESVKARLGI